MRVGTAVQAIPSKKALQTTRNSCKTDIKPEVAENQTQSTGLYKTF